MSRIFLSFAASLMLVFALFANLDHAHAGPLDDAKAEGLVGEQMDGYVGIVGGNGNVQGLVDDINAKRRAKYAEIAKKRSAPTEAVAQIAGKKLIERTPAGQYVRGSDGQWRQK